MGSDPLEAVSESYLGPAFELDLLLGPGSVTGIGESAVGDFPGTQPQMRTESQGPELLPAIHCREYAQTLVDGGVDR